MQDIMSAFQVLKSPLMFAILAIIAHQDRLPQSKFLARKAHLELSLWAWFQMTALSVPQEVTVTQ